MIALRFNWSDQSLRVLPSWVNERTQNDTYLLGRQDLGASSSCPDVVYLQFRLHRIGWPANSQQSRGPSRKFDARHSATTEFRIAHATCTKSVAAAARGRWSIANLATAAPRAWWRNCTQQRRWPNLRRHLLAFFFKQMGKVVKCSPFFLSRFIFLNVHSINGISKYYFVHFLLPLSHSFRHLKKLNDGDISHRIFWRVHILFSYHCYDCVWNKSDLYNFTFWTDFRLFKQMVQTYRQIARDYVMQVY